jgi:hypothetical protein
MSIEIENYYFACVIIDKYVKNEKGRAYICRMVRFSFAELCSHWEEFFERSM